MSFSDKCIWISLLRTKATRSIKAWNTTSYDSEYLQRAQSKLALLAMATKPQRAFETLWPSRSKTPARWWRKKSNKSTHSAQGNKYLNAGKDHVLNINMFVQQLVMPFTASSQLSSEWKLGCLTKVTV